MTPNEEVVAYYSRFDSQDFEHDPIADFLEYTNEAREQNFIDTIIFSTLQGVIG